VYRAQNIIGRNKYAVAVKLEEITGLSSSVEHEYYILKQLEGGVGIPRTLWFGRESTYYALVLELLGPSLYDLFLARNRKFSLHTIVNIGDQVVRQFSSGCCSLQMLTYFLSSHASNTSIPIITFTVILNRRMS
jgi:hypothetical protein